MRLRLVACVVGLSSAVALGGKPTIKWAPPASTEDDRPLIRELIVGPQGSDYALKVEFDKEPWGDACKSRCANATVFLDTDNNKNTGLKLKDPKAAETGADLAITLQGTRDVRGSETVAVLKAKVKQFNEEATSVDQGTSLAELDRKRDADRLTSDGTTVWVLVDTNLGNLPQAAKLRVVYHPPDQAALVATTTGMLTKGAARVEIFKEGKLANPLPKPKPPPAAETP